MKYVIVFYLSIFSVLASTNINAKDSATHYLSTSQMVVDSFFQLYNTLDSPKPKVVLTNGNTGERFIEYKKYLIKRFRPKRTTYKIRSFESLNSNELRFISYLSDKFGNKSKVKDYYYKLVNYWLLPHYLSHHLGIPNHSEEDNLSYKDMIEFETAVDKRCFVFMIESGFINEFQDFYALMSRIQTAIKLPSIYELYEEYKIAEDVSDSFLDLYLKSATMLDAIRFYLGEKSLLLESDPEKHHLDNSNMVINRFREHFDTSFTEKYRLVYQEESRIKAPVLIEHKKGLTHILIRPYSSLNVNEIKLIESINSVYSEDTNPEHLYYEIINYWILPVNLSKYSLEPKIKSHIAPEILNINQHALAFLNKSNLIQNHDNFNRLVQVVRSACIHGIDKEQSSPITTEHDISKKNILHHLNYYAEDMIGAIEQRQEEAHLD